MWSAPLLYLSVKRVPWKTEALFNCSSPGSAKNNFVRLDMLAQRRPHLLSDIIVELSWQSYGQYFANRIGRSRVLCFSPDTSACLQVTCRQHEFIQTAFTSTTLLLFCGRRVARTLEAEMQACNTVKLRISLYHRPHRPPSVNTTLQNATLHAI